MLAVLACGLFVVHPAARVVGVRAGDSLQRALDAARPGDTIWLERGVEYVGNFVLPATADEDTRVITLRTYSDWGLPGSGQRITPAQAPALAVLRSPNSGPALRTAPGAHHWRIQLIEFRANDRGLGDIIALGDGGGSQRAASTIPHDLTLERLFVHGDPLAGQKRGIALNAAAVTIRDSWVSDIKAVGQDSQAIAGWNGPGPYLIENNTLEAAGENVMFGGADPSIIGLTPASITIRGNTVSKPLAWRAATPPRWQVKNLLELKHARDVVIEDNVLERSWQEAQTGYAVLFTVRNQDGGCPWCEVSGVTFRRNLVRDVAAGVQVAGEDSAYPARPMTDIVIADNVFDRIDRDTWGGDGYFLTVGGSPQGVRVDHNTVLSRSSGGLIKLADGVSRDFVFSNNLAHHGDYGIIGTDRGVGDDSIRTYLPGARIERNVLAGGDGRRYPPGNFFPSVGELPRHFQDYASGNFRLALGSPWRRAASDGRDIGANVGAVAAATRRPSR